MTDSARAQFDSARMLLADAPVVHLGSWTVPKRVFGLARAPRVVPAGTAWHLGVLLLTEDAVFSTGEIVRAQEEDRRGFTAESQRQRAELAAAIFRGGYPEGTAVHVGWSDIDLDALDRGEASGPLLPSTDEPLVRWSTVGAPQPLSTYLRERVALLLDPPQPAS